MAYSKHIHLHLKTTQKYTMTLISYDNENRCNYFSNDILQLSSTKSFKLLDKIPVVVRK